MAASELRTGLPGSADEATGGDGAACFLFGESNEALAEVLASPSATEEFLDRWRVPGQHASRLWEDRFKSLIVEDGVAAKTISAYIMTEGQAFSRRAILPFLRKRPKIHPLPIRR